MVWSRSLTVLAILLVADAFGSQSVTVAATLVATGQCCRSLLRVTCHWMHSHTCLTADLLPMVWMSSAGRVGFIYTSVGSVCGQKGKPR